MAILDQIKPATRVKASLPIAPTLPQGRPRMPTHQEFAEDAKRAEQRYLDMVAHNEALHNELETWRNRALLAETEVDQRKLRENDLETENNQLRQTITMIASLYLAASKILAEGGAKIEESGALRPRVNLAALAAAIHPPIEPPADDDKLPSVVSQGPAQHDGE